ncbi:DEAD/DEAH box helicase [Providencia alcalifaciens]|uniref:DEAD/DEAH box helicase n=1 Tax=Providencia alcalifaciens TaxID=126385 RepID=UPI001CE1E766|nr:DEAD/DEAH box helicase [Providencia alcalifaciens]UBX48545.1 DEAD/DEAH box helicase [Providencia alcalifaciens]
MAKTRHIIQVKEQIQMKETVQPEHVIQPEENKQIEQEEKHPDSKVKSKVKFKEVVCPSVPMSYFKRAKKQKY